MSGSRFRTLAVNFVSDSFSPDEVLLSRNILMLMMMMMMMMVVIIIRMAR